MNRNSEAPATTSALCATGNQTGNPDATAMAPYDRPMTQTARQARAMSRGAPRPRGLYIEPMDFIVTTEPRVRQSEHLTYLPNDPSSGAPLDLIAAALRRERRRSG